MANGYRITAIVFVVLSFLLLGYGAGGNSAHPGDTIQEKQYERLLDIQSLVGAMSMVVLAIFFLLMGYTKENKKK
jgi:hypothetical protein